MVPWAPDAVDLVPLALAARLASIAMALGLARRPRWSRVMAFSGSVVASLLSGVIPTTTV